MDALFRKVKKTSNGTKVKGNTARHEKLGEGWAENTQPVAEEGGVAFYLKYLGFTLVDEAGERENYGDGASTKAVHRIVTMAKSAGKKLKKVALQVSLKGIHMVDIITKEILLDISIYRISFCTADKSHDKVCAFIARNTINETMECHAFLCAKSKIAQAVTLTVWQSFNAAQNEWKSEECAPSAGPTDKTNTVTDSQEPRSQSSIPQVTPQSTARPTTHQHLISLRPPPSSPHHHSSDHKRSRSPATNGMNGAHYQPSATANCEEENLEDSFSRLAETRGRGQIPSFGTDLRQEDVDEGVQLYMDGQRCFEEFSRQKSIEDLLSI